MPATDDTLAEHGWLARRGSEAAANEDILGVVVRIGSLGEAHARTGR